MTYIVAEVDGGLTKVLKQANTLSELSRMDIDPGIFPAVFVSREDIDRSIHEEDYMTDEPDIIDFKVSRLTDEEMIEVCDDLQNQYVGYGSYWDDLAYLCEDLLQDEED